MDPSHDAPIGDRATPLPAPATTGPLPPALFRSVLRITLLYAVFAAAWIYLSDRAVGHIASTGDEVLRYSFWKGAAFVSVTALLLFVLMLGIFGRLDGAYRLLVRSEAEIARFNRLYAALSEVNQACLWSTSREALFQQTCQALVEHGGLKLAWIGQPPDPPGPLVPVAVHGDEAGYLGKIAAADHDAPESNSATALAFRKGRPIVKNHLMSDPESLPWRQLAREHGFAACAAFPIREADEVGTVLGVYSHEPAFFKEREVALLKQAVTNLAYALDNLRREQRRQAAEAQVHTERQVSQAMLESMPGIIFLYNHDGKMLRWNRSLEVASGYTAAQIAGMHPRDFFVEEGRGRVDAAIQGIFGGGVSNLEARVQSRDGKVTRYQVISHQIEIGGVRCVLGQGVEIVHEAVAVDALPADAGAAVAPAGGPVP